MNTKEVNIQLLGEGKPVVKIGNATISPEGVSYLFVEFIAGETPLFYVSNDRGRYETKEKKEIRAQIEELIERLKA